MMTESGVPQSRCGVLNADWSVGDVYHLVLRSVDEKTRQDNSGSDS